MDWDAQPAPRFAAAYDLFGDGRTAIKANVGLYRETWSSEIMREYTAARAASSSTFNWTDLNRDDIAQEAEFLPAGCITCGSNRNFGFIANTRITEQYYARHTDERLQELHDQFSPDPEIATAKDARSAK